MGWFSDLISAPTSSIGDLFSGNVGGSINDILKPGEDVLPFGLGNQLQDNIVNPVENFIGNNYQFGLDQLHRFGDQFKQNPAGFLGETFLGAGTPLGSKAWNALTGDNTQPLVTMLGGPTKDTFQYSANKGTNTEDAGYTSSVANLIAGAYAGGELGDLGSSAWAGSGLADAAAGSDEAINAGDALAGTGSNAGYAADVDSGALSGPGGTQLATNTGGSLSGGFGIGGSGTAGNLTRSSVLGTSNALDNNKNPFQGFATGAATGLAGSPINYAGAAGIDDPLYKNALNGAVTGGIKSGMAGTNSLYGSLLGLLGGAGNTPSSSGTAGAGTGVSGLGSLAAGLGQLYLGHMANQGVQGQINNLNSLYSPNSPYAQQMQQALERQDAASGRRSQYGTRSVELQAALANANSRNAPQLSNLYQQQVGNRFGMAAGLLGAAHNGGFNGLQGLFGGQQGSPTTYSGGGNGTGGYDMGGQSFNNPSAYSAQTPQQTQPYDDNYMGGP